MKIQFIYLPHPYLRTPDAQLPLGILYLAGVCEGQGHDVSVVNLTKYNSPEEAITHVTEADIFGITVTSLELPIADKMTIQLRDKFPKAKVILGGPGTSGIEEHLHNHKLYDAIFLGEAEEALVKYLWDEVGKVRCRPSYWSGVLPKIDTIRFPARHLVHGSLGGKIFTEGKEYFSGGSTTILSSRGCPYRCAFCAEAGTHVRFRSSDSVVQEMLEVYRQYGIRQFRFSDDSFTLRRDRVLDICKKIKETGIEFAWRISCRVKPLDMDILRTMVEAGCREFSFGIESFDNYVLKGLRKNTTAEDNAVALKMVHDAGGDARILFMVRTPFQTKATIEKNKWWLDHVPYSTIACTSFVPLPGSAIWQRPEEFKIKIINRNMEDYNFYFYGPDGRNKIKRIFEYTDRDTDEVEQESEDFRTYLEEKGRVNNG